MNEIYAALIGGAVIGLAATMLLLFNGRVFGISGILGRAVSPVSGDTNTWRYFAILGLILGGAFVGFLNPASFPEIPYRPVAYVIAGLLVGIGTQLGSGCTSGHGVCGISRFSVRGIVATVTFMAAGIITVAIIGAM